jgi:hypothetical protein
MALSPWNRGLVGGAMTNTSIGMPLALDPRAARHARVFGWASIG